jgi:plasmid stabilization system protein ParE
MPRPRILREAAEELEAAAAHLERQRPGYAALFLDAYEEKLRQLARFPASGPAIEKAPGGYPLRAFLIGKSPYSIIAGPDRAFQSDGTASERNLRNSGA